MAKSNDGKTKANRALVTLAFLGVMVIIFVVAIGILPYKNQPSPETNGTDSSTPALDPNRQYQFGVTDYLTGNYKAAIEDFTTAIDGHYTPLARAEYGRGLAYYYYSIDTQDEVSLDNSIADFRAALELDPNYTEVYPALGWAYYQRASFYKEEEQTPYFQQAFDVFQKGLELNKKLGQTDSQIYDGLGWTYYKLGNDQDAIDNFKLALQFNPDMEDAQEGLNAAKADLQK
jgi:tetratricopeptide (TPR) repeat protein